MAFVLFMLNLGDFIRAKRENHNGPIQFMNLDNLRHQGFILFIVLIVLARILGLIDQETAFQLVVTVILFDALFTFFRRRKMADLVQAYLTKEDHVVAANLNEREQYEPPITEGSAVRTSRGSCSDCWDAVVRYVTDGEHSRGVVLAA